MACTEIFTISFKQSTKEHIVNFNLQLFSEEKTEEATPKRKQEARKRGQVAKSTEVNSAFILLAAFYSLKILGPNIYNEISSFMRFIFTHFSTQDFTIRTAHTLFLNIGLVFLKTALPIMGIIAIISLAINFMQVGFMFTLEPLMPQFSRINPISGFQRLFSKRSLVELVKSISKVFIIGYFIYNYFNKEILSLLPKFIGGELLDSLKITAGLTVDLAFHISGVMIVLASLDYLYQWWEHNQSLKMSKQELKEEYKQTEGNPQIKGKIKEKQRAMAMRRMMQDVPKADVIITNPTHYAIALKYEEKMPAPSVVAKGQDFLAQRIKQIAKDHSVLIVENKPLARALYKTTEIGDIIPPELYQAVAEVLAYVYKLKKRLS